MKKYLKNFLIFSAGSDSGIVIEAGKRVARLANGFPVQENVQKQVSAPTRPDSVLFTNIMDDLDQMTKELDSCLVKESSPSCELSGVIIVVL